MKKGNGYGMLQYRTAVSNIDTEKLSRAMDNLIHVILR